MRWVVLPLIIAHVGLLLVGCGRPDSPPPQTTPPVFATHLPFPTTAPEETPTPPPDLTQREVSRMVIDGLDACIDAELSTVPSVPSREELWRSRNFAVRYVGNDEWLVRAGFELPNVPAVLGTWRVNESTGEIVGHDYSSAGHSIADYCQRMLEEETGKPGPMLQSTPVFLP